MQQRYEFFEKEDLTDSDQEGATDRNVRQQDSKHEEYNHVS